MLPRSIPNLAIKVINSGSQLAIFLTNTVLRGIELVVLLQLYQATDSLLFMCGRIDVSDHKNPDVLTSLLGEVNTVTPTE